MTGITSTSASIPPGYNGGYARLTLDELAIYDAVLAPADIIALYTRFGAEFDAAEVVESDAAGLTLPLLSIKEDITLPDTGISGSSIRWSSSNEAVMTSQGQVSRPAAGENDAPVTLTTTIEFGGYSMKKAFDLTVEAMPAFTNLSNVSMGDVTLLNPYEQNAFTKEVAYLKFLDADRLLKGYCLIGGVESSAQIYGGWENSAIKGHTLGHYLSALSQAYATCNDEELKAIADHIVEVLAQCQNAETGYLSAIPESHFTQIEQGNTAGTWVPWYNMHKLMSGLIHAWELTGNAQALDVASRLGDWVYSRTSKWSPATQITVLNVEYGGMNDVLYQLYSHTRAENHLSAAHSFDEMALFDALYNGQDVLNGKHANTTIPKIVGALQRYMVLGEGEEYYLQVAENFWEIVVNNHTYITGGNSEWEHFGEPNILEAERTNCNCETCNTYNMLKLTRGLFKVTGSRKYADYYENTYINAILSSQNPETGMTTYFQPMASGYFKVYSTPDQHFWCCTGSGMENFSKLGDSIYYQDDSSLYVTRYTASSVQWRAKGMTVTMETDIPMTDQAVLTIAADAPVAADIVLRVPDWCAGEPLVQINGEAAGAAAVNGFIRLIREWHGGDIISIMLPSEIRVHPLPDDPGVVAFKYGPVVLSADLGQNSMTTGVTGVDVTVPSADLSASEVLRIAEGTTEAWLQNVGEHLVRDGAELRFTLRGTDRDLVFTPHYQQHQSRYAIYVRLTDETAADAEDTTRYIVIDSLPVANDQYEFSHNLQGSKTGTGMHLGRNYRHAEASGFFSYDMAVEQGVQNYLCVNYFSGDAGRRFTVLVNDVVLASVTLENVNPGKFYDVYYPIPASLTEGTDQVTITFNADQGGYAGGIFEKLSIVKRKD